MNKYAQNLLKRSDKIAKLLFKNVTKKKIPSVLTTPKSFLVIRPGGAGDAVLLTPSIAMLKEVFQDAKVGYLGEKRNIEFAKECLSDQVDEFFIYDSPNFPIFLLENFGKWDVVIDTEQSFFLPSQVARFCGKMTVGFSTNPHDIMIKYLHGKKEYENFFELFKAVVEFFQKKPPSFEVLMRKGRRKMKEKFLDKRKENSKKPKIVLAPFSSKREKFWSEWEKFFDLASQKLGAEVEVLGNKSLPVREIFKKVGEADVVVSVDSVFVHIAWLFGVPTVAIFGPTNFVKWTNENTVVLKNGKLCSPCSHFAEIPPCPFGVECMKVSPHQVLEEVKKILEMV